MVKKQDIMKLHDEAVQAAVNAAVRNLGDRDLPTRAALQSAVEAAVNPNFIRMNKERREALDRAGMNANLLDAVRTERDQLRAERDALAAKLKELQEQEPVADDDIEVIEHVRNSHYKLRSRYHLEEGTKLYTAPKALEREFPLLTAAEKLDVKDALEIAELVIADDFSDITEHSFITLSRAILSLQRIATPAAPKALEPFVLKSETDSDKITIPRKTFDAMREALEGVKSRCKRGYIGMDGQYLKVVDAALAAANALDHSEQHLDMVQPQAYGEPEAELISACCALVEYLDKNPPMGESIWAIHRIRTALRAIPAGTDDMAIYKKIAASTQPQPTQPQVQGERQWPRHQYSALKEGATAIRRMIEVYGWHKENETSACILDSMRLNPVTHLQPTTPAITAPELEARQGWVRYEKLRKLSPRQFDELHARNLKGEFFDDMVDSLPEPPTPKPWEFAAPKQDLCTNCTPEGRCMKRQALCNAKLGVTQGQCGAQEQAGKEGV